MNAREQDVRSTVSQEADERVVRRFFDALDAGDFEAIRGLLAPDFVLYVARPNVTLGPTRFVSALRLLRESFPDLAFDKGRRDGHGSVGRYRDVRRCVRGRRPDR